MDFTLTHLYYIINSITHNTSLSLSPTTAALTSFFLSYIYILLVNISPSLIHKVLQLLITEDFTFVIVYTYVYIYTV